MASKSHLDTLDPTPGDVPRELHFTPTNGPVDDTIDALMSMVGGIDQRGVVREMILASLKAGQESDRLADLKLMNASLKEMRFTSKVFAPYRGRRKVSVFGSARVPQGTPAYTMARRLGRRLAEAGYMVITGGGPGIMQAINEGAGADNSFGINIRLPFEQKPNPVVDGNPKSINYKYFFNRKVAFLKEADAIVLFPGGFGTLDEAMETLTLVQTGKRNPLPVIMVEVPGRAYWDAWRNCLIHQLEGAGFVRPDDLAIFQIVTSEEAVVEAIDAFYTRFHSLRQVGPKLVLRLKAALPAAGVDALRREFHDLLLTGGTMEPSGPLPAEADEPHLAHLPRLILDFNRESFARLKQLIEALNRWV
jgi:uncharacterized protein (TIGR00730 family)